MDDPVLLDNLKVVIEAGKGKNVDTMVSKLADRIWYMNKQKSKNVGGNVEIFDENDELLQEDSSSDEDSIDEEEQRILDLSDSTPVKEGTKPPKKPTSLNEERRKKMTK